MSLPIVRREAADRDVEAAVRFYRVEAGTDVALGFVSALGDAFDSIAAQPGLGSPRYGEELGLPGLRHWPLKRFPHLIFYRERADAIEVWRVLHARRDIGGSLDEDHGSA